MLKRRKKSLPLHQLTNGPGSVCQALGIDLTYIVSSRFICP
ncbi:hypothetical protein [Cardinium endosymbiont of Tipula unca]